MKRLLCLVSVLLMVATFLSAEGSQESPDQEAAQEITFWRAGTGGVEQDYWEGFMERFNEDYPDATVNYSEVPWSDFQTRLNVAFASGTAPDIVHYPIASISQRASLGQFMPVTDYYDAWEGKDDYLDNLYELGEYKDELYGLVTFTDPRVLFWRKDYFEEAGLDPEDPPSNWEELEEFALQLTIREGGVTTRGGFELPEGNTNQIVQVFALQNGGQFVNEDTGEILFDSPAVVEAAEFLARLEDQNVNIPFDQLGGSDAPFEQGRVAMAYTSPNAIRTLLSNNPDLEGKIGAAPPLERTQQGTFCGARLFYMSSESENPDLAWAFIEQGMSSEEAQIRYDSLLVTPNRTSLLDAYYEDNPEMNRATVEAIRVGGQGIPKVPFYPQLNRAVSTAMERAFYNDEDPAVTFAEEAQKLREELEDFTLGSGN